MTRPQRNRRPKTGDRGPETADLNAFIQQAYLRGVEKHGELEITLNDFAEHLRSVISKETGVAVDDLNSNQEAAIKLLADLYTSDLYLTSACTAMSNVAWVRLHRLYQPFINKVAHAYCNSSQGARDVSSDIIAHLCLPGRSGRCRIASYNGRSSLGAWIAAIVKNKAINQGELKFGEGLPLETPGLTSRASTTSIETALIDSQHRESIAASLREALENLSERERLVLILHVKDGLTATEIARRFHVHKSQPTRALQRVENKMRAAVAKRLGPDQTVSVRAMIEFWSRMLSEVEAPAATSLERFFSMTQATVAA